MIKEQINNHWSILSIWNASFEAKPRRKDEARDYIYASELLGSCHDIYLKMINVPQTNPPTLRSLRKFEAGNLYEWCLRFVLLRSGVLKQTQERIKNEIKGCVPVSGRLDFVAGGELDFSQAEKEIESLELPEFFDFTAKRMIAYFKEKYEGLKLHEYVIECKSCSSFVFDRNERAGKANDNHIMQNYHYIRGKDMQQGKILYINKDDCRLQEFNVFNNEENAATYQKFIEKISDFYYQKIVPPKEKEIEFDYDACSFRKNWKIEYSPYLKHSYGYEMPEDFFNRWQPLVAKINRVYKRCVNEDKMTAANLDIIKEAKQYYPNWDELVDIGKSKGIVEEESELLTD